MCIANFTSTFGEVQDTMEIKFRHDADQVLAEAKQQKKPVVLDFSAAPM